MHTVSKQQCLYFQLDYKITWKKLKDVFRLAGNVTRAEIKEDKDGKSRGMGTVTFETPFEAVQAVCILLYITLGIKSIYIVKN